jgi:hypothetical protein
MERIDTIKAIIDLHNFFVKNYRTKFEMSINPEDLWNKDLVDVKFDRYYLVESLIEKSCVDDDKLFEPCVELRYMLRSAEAHAYGSKHDAYYKKYLVTIPFTYDAIADPDLYKQNLILELAKR